MSKIQTVQYIPVTQLIPTQMVKQGFWEVISESAPFTWGDADHTLIPAYVLGHHIESHQDCLADSGINHRRTDRLLRKLRDLDETFVDMEN